MNQAGLQGDSQGAPDEVSPAGVIRQLPEKKPQRVNRVAAPLKDGSRLVGYAFGLAQRKARHAAERRQLSTQ